MSILQANSSPVKALCRLASAVDAMVGSDGRVTHDADDEAWWASECGRVADEAQVARRDAYLADRARQDAYAEACRLMDARSLGLIPAVLAESIMGRSIVGHPA